VIEAAAHPQGAVALIAVRGLAAATPGCTDHISSQHIRDRTKDLTGQSSRFIVANLHLRNDSPPFHPVHPLIRAFGPQVLHHAKGRGPIRKFVASVQLAHQNEVYLLIQ
jgi:hypothetical protein